METIVIEIPSIKLEWSEWYPWHKYKLNRRTNPNAIKVPKQPGVYEAKLIYDDECLTIGKSDNLHRRIVECLVKGFYGHSAGERIRNNEDTAQIIIRWAITDRPSCVEEELHRQYVDRFDHLPKYTQRT